MTILAQLVASTVDSFGYTTYVFKCLEEDIAAITRYVMCTRYPNWNHRRINIGETGFLTFEEIRAGVDKWYNGKEMIPYKYDAIQFLKFVDNPEKAENEYIM